MVENDMFYVYVLQCSDGSLYTGYTNDIAKRMAKHNMGKGAKYVRSKLPVILVHEERFATKSEAMKREHEIKQWSREQKVTKLALKLHPLKPLPVSC